VSVDRAPIRRPSMAGVVGDSAGRVRGMEAAQTMPYCIGVFEQPWPASQDLWGLLDIPTNDIFLPVSFDPGFVASYGGKVWFQTTDSSIFRNSYLENQPYGDVSALFIYGPGLFYWQFSVRIMSLTDNFNMPIPPFPTDVRVAMSKNNRTSYNGEDCPPYSILSNQPGLYTPSTPWQDNSPWTAVAGGDENTYTGNGLFSTTGLFQLRDDQTQESFIPQSLVLQVVKDFPSNMRIVAKLVVARWSPVGFAIGLTEGGEEFCETENYVVP